jgi:DNA-binding XRE family transcriptional regulator
MAAGDDALRVWGENIRNQRLVLRPDGAPRRSGADAVMTQADLGSLLDPPVRQSTVHRWETGAMEPRRRYKVQLARALHLDVRTLFPLLRAA